MRRTLLCARRGPGDAGGLQAEGRAEGRAWTLPRLLGRGAGVAAPGCREPLCGPCPCWTLAAPYHRWGAGVLCKSAPSSSSELPSSTPSVLQLALRCGVRNPSPRCCCADPSKGCWLDVPICSVRTALSSPPGQSLCASSSPLPAAPLPRPPVRGSGTRVSPPARAAPLSRAVRSGA